MPSQRDILPSQKQGGKPMAKATVDLATEIAHDLNVTREFVWEIIKGMRYNSVEELEIRVCKAIVGESFMLDRDVSPK
jgi:hypothetical protein